MTPQAESILDLFRTTGAYLNGHFRLTSGLHSPAYLQCALVLQYPRHAAELGGLLADELRKLVPEPVGLVVSPALGGLIIGHEVARALRARFIFTERDENKKMTLRRGFTVSPGEPALVIEDVVTTGGSTIRALEAVRAEGHEVCGVLAICDRLAGGAQAIEDAAGAPFRALTTIDEIYPERPDRTG